MVMFEFSKYNSKFYQIVNLRFYKIFMKLIEVHIN